MTLMARSATIRESLEAGLKSCSAVVRRTA
jgi:hypothetical protein